MDTSRLPDRFWNKVVTEHSGCWIWVGSRCSGYGDFRWNNKTRKAHKVAYETLIGPVPDGLELDHLCRNRSCVNPHHLEPVTHTENVRRGDRFSSGAINRNKKNCRYGHPYDEANTYLRPDGRRGCRECRRQADKKRRRR